MLNFELQTSDKKNMSVNHWFIGFINRQATKKENPVKTELSFLCGATGNRTRDTRIFSPLLYQLSYGTLLLKSGAKVQKNLNHQNV